MGCVYVSRAIASHRVGLKAFRTDMGWGAFSRHRILFRRARAKDVALLLSINAISLCTETAIEKMKESRGCSVSRQRPQIQHLFCSRLKMSMIEIDSLSLSSALSAIPN